MSIESELAAFGVTQVLVVMKEPTAATGNSKLADRFTSSENSRSGALALAGAASNVRRGSARGGVSRPTRRRPIGKTPSFQVYPNLGVMLGTVDPVGYAGLQSSSEVQAVHAAPEFSLIRPVGVVEATSLSSTATWGLGKLRVRELWSKGFTGKGVIVGHLDTGIDAKHPALRTSIHAFAEFDRLGNIVPDAKPWDSDSHGTHTAGTIAGRAVPEGQFGVAPECKLASAMVIEGGNVVARILGGMDWVIGQGAKILNMSLGVRGYSESFLALMRILRNRGVMPVIAVGNEGPGTSRSPGNYSVSLSVGASDASDKVSDFSSSQAFQRIDDPLVPDLVAPGSDVFSAMPGGKFGKLSGSSMATPHVAGLAALLYQAKPTATVDEVENAIFSSCTRPSTMPKERANRGIPDAVKAIQFLLGRDLSDLSGSESLPAKGAKRRGKKSARADRPRSGRKTTRGATRTRRQGKKR
jgi:subtilisin